MTDKEGTLYPYVLHYLQEKYNFEPKHSGYTYSNGVNKEEAKSLKIHHVGTRVRPDVFGLSVDGKIVLAEGKASCGGTILDTAIGQAVTYQRFSHFVYVFFPRQELLDPKLLEYVKVSVEHHGLGLLQVADDGTVEELLEPQLSPFLRQDDTLFFSVFENIVSTREALLELDPWSEEQYSRLERGPRAYLIRDFCSWFSQNGTKFKNKSIEQLAELFRSWIEEYLRDNQMDVDNYWRAQYAGARTSIEESRSEAAVHGSIFFDFVEKTNNSTSLTELGKSLVATSSNVGQPDLSLQERALFFAIGWKSPGARKLIDVLSNSNNSINLHKNSCGHYKVVNIDGRPKCVKDDKFLDYEDLSIVGMMYFEYEDVVSYYKRSFWIRSEIFTTSGQSAVKFAPLI